MHYEDSELLDSALLRYYLANQLPSDGGVSDPWARYTFGNLDAIAFPNFEIRNEALRRHDIHHILNNLDTSPLGEGLIAAWELGSGCGRFWISWFMESQALWWGILLSPRQTLHFFILGRKSQNFFHNEIGDSKKKSVGDLRSRMIPSTQDLVLSVKDVFQFGLMAALGFMCMVIFFPTVFTFTVIGFLVGANRRI